MITFKEYTTQEAATDTNKHLAHLDELILTKGYEGGVNTIAYITQLLDLLHSHTPAPINTTVKIDGAPAIVCGRDSTGNFFIGTKSVFTKEPKLNYSLDDIDINHGSVPELAKKMKDAFRVLRKVNFDGVYQGDLLFWPGLIKHYTIDNVKYIGFRPNTILYTVKADSKEAEEILAATIGIVFHTKYAPTKDEDGKERFINKQFGINAEHLKAPGAYISDALISNKAGTISLTNDESVYINKQIHNLEYILASIDFKLLSKQVPELMSIFVNDMIRRGQFIQDVDHAFAEFKEWVSARSDREIEKLKRKQQRIDAKTALLELLDKQSVSIINMMSFIRDVKLVKDIFIKKYDAIMQGTALGTFLVQANGDITVTTPEGYVVFDDAQNGVKIIDRINFSRANFLIPKNWIKNEA